MVYFISEESVEVYDQEKNSIISKSLNKDIRVPETPYTWTTTYGSIAGSNKIVIVGGEYFQVLGMKVYHSNLIFMMLKNYLKIIFMRKWKKNLINKLVCMDIKKVYIHPEYMSLLKKQEDQWISKNWRKLKDGNFYFIFNGYSWLFGINICEII